MICFWLKGKLYVCFSVFACIVNVDYQLLYHFPVFEVEVVNVLDYCAKLGSISFAHFAHICYQFLKLYVTAKTYPSKRHFLVGAVYYTSDALLVLFEFLQSLF